MNRRAAISLLSALPWMPPHRDAAGEPGKPLPPFWKSRLPDIDEAIGQIQKGKVIELARSAGHRKIYLIRYGDKPDWKTAANYNSACGGNHPASYAAKDGKQPPTLFLLGPVHGAEFEGTVGLLNLIQIAESGKDDRGRSWEDLAERISRCRVLIVPTGNPDGRARCPFDSWVGEDLDVNERVGMGVKPDGSNYQWPGVKRIHPMRGAVVKSLGAYFNDDGVNLMHDDWFAPGAIAPVPRVSAVFAGSSPVTRLESAASASGSLE
jgi:hypothetical protein